MLDTMVKETLGELIKKRRKEKGLSQNKLADIAGISRSYIILIEQGKRSGRTSADMILKLARALDVSPQYLMGLSDDSAEKAKRTIAEIEEMLRTARTRDVDGAVDEVRKLPILGRVPAGYPLPEEQKAEGFLPVPRAQLGYAREIPSLYVLIVTGDSLIGDDIQPGDKLIVNPNDKVVVDGKIYVVRVENEVTVKHVSKKGDRIVLEPSNHKYGVMAPDQVEILGRVILAGNWKEL